MKKIIIIIVYFGKFPEWFELFLESCKTNKTIDWIIFTDNKFSKKANNIKFKKFNLIDLNKLATKKLNQKISIKNNYKICDLRPAFGKIFEDYLKNYDFYGYGDIDVIYGKLRKFLTNKILQHKIISFHNNILSGHLCFFKNMEENKKIFKKIPWFIKKVNDRQHFGLDEHIAFQAINHSKLYVYIYHFINDNIMNINEITNKFKKKFKKIPKKKLQGKYPYYKKKQNIFIELYTTPNLKFIPWIYGKKEYPTEWYWKNGKLTNNINGNIEFIYFHFMVWKGGHFKKYNGYGLWEEKKSIINGNIKNLKKGFKINKFGFFPL